MILEFFFNGIESGNLMKMKSVLINLIFMFNGIESGNLIKIKMMLKKILFNFCYKRKIDVKEDEYDVYGFV